MARPDDYTGAQPCVTLLSVNRRRTVERLWRGLRLPVVVTLIAALAVAVPSSPTVRAGAESVANVPFPSAGALVLDAGRSRVYVTGSTGSTFVWVADLNGNEVRRIPGITGAVGAVLADGGRTLLVAEREADELA